MTRPAAQRPCPALTSPSSCWSGRGRVGLGVVFGVALALALGCPGAPPDAGPTDASDPEPEVEPDAGPTPDPFHDPLARPSTPTLDLNNFTEAETCGDCHTDHYEQWRGSMHAYAMVDPVFRAIVDVRQQDFDGEQDQFCTQCHSPTGTRGGAIPDNFSFSDLGQKVLDGVSCETCHKAVEVVRPNNSGLRIDPFAPMQGPIADPTASDFHATNTTDLLGTPELCASCHDVIETTGLNIERPYQEYLQSPGYAEGTTCQDCHMPTYTGRATQDTPERELHSHAFLGVDVPLLDGFVDEPTLEDIRANVRDLLDGSGKLRLSAEEFVAPGSQLDLFVSIENMIDSHSLPTGTTSIRQLWVDVVATDANGTVLYQTGDLDDNGDLRNAFSALDPYGDNDLLALNSTLINAEGAPEIFSWRATEHITNAIRAGHDRVFTLFVPIPEDAVSPVFIDARLRFRTHGPFLLRALDLEEYVDKLEIYEVDADSLQIELTTP